MSATCPYHSDHENRIKRLENHMDDKKLNPGIWLGIFSFLGVIVSTIGSTLGAVINAYFK